MSGIVGLYNIDGREIDPEVFDRMMLLLGPWGPDGTAKWLGGSVALGHGAFHTTPEDRGEVQPLADASGTRCLTFDGRIDNREEIRCKLVDHGLEPRTDSDAELVLCAYVLWGEDCAAHLLGDFAFAIWDGRDRRLYCARDIVGCRPFYYHHDRTRFVFGSEAAQVLEAPSIDTAPNEGVVAEFLAVEVTSRDETLYRGIQRLPPAHYLVVTDRGLRCCRYWDIDLYRQVRYDDPLEYTERLFELLREAVRCRMRSAGPVGAELSGGVDSSSVVCMAQHLVREGLASGQGFETFSWIFPGMKCDESRYIGEVLSMWNLRSNTVFPRVAARVFSDQVRQSRYITTDAIGVHADLRKDLQHARGFRVILTGLGGDEWLSGADNPYPDLLKGLRCRQVLAELRRDVCELGRARAIRLLLSSAAQTSRPLCGIRDAIRRRRDRMPWLTDDFRRRTALDDRCDSIYAARRFPSNAQRERYWSLAAGWLPLGCEMNSWSSARHQVDQRHPLYDRRIIEFAFGIPEEYRRRNGEQKFLLRRAMQNLVPSAILNRRTKADFSHVTWDLLGSLGHAELSGPMEIAKRGWVDGDRLTEMCRVALAEYRTGGEPVLPWVPWSAYAIETWLRVQ
jgi:asparagine synthase (glutamine-hydrolysing)